MKITLISVLVDDQQKALEFYTDTLGFITKNDIPMGEARWLTVVSPDAPDGVELLLEPMGFAPAKTYQSAVFEAGLPFTAFAVDDIQQEYERLSGLGVVFSMEPTEAGPVIQAIFEDTCGNRIQIYQTTE